MTWICVPIIGITHQSTLIKSVRCFPQKCRGHRVTTFLVDRICRTLSPYSNISQSLTEPKHFTEEFTIFYSKLTLLSNDEQNTVIQRQTNYAQEGWVRWKVQVDRVWRRSQQGSKKTLCTSKISSNSHLEKEKKTSRRVHGATTLVAHSSENPVLLEKPSRLT